MFWVKQICPDCATGQKSYELDKHSYACPYISCLKNGKCRFYVQLKTHEKAGVFKKKDATIGV